MIPSVSVHCASFILQRNPATFASFSCFGMFMLLRLAAFPIIHFISHFPSNETSCRMIITWILVLFIFIVSLFSVNGISESSEVSDKHREEILNINPYKHILTLDHRNKFKLAYEVNWKEKRVIFNTTVATNGYIGFGLSKNGKMLGADIIIGGVDSTGKPYFSDRHGIRNQIVLDDSQDYILEEAWERGALTFLSFSRPFDTCDGEGDLPINDNLLSIIWAYSEKDDDLQYHFENRGMYDVYILDPPNFKKGFESSILFQINSEVILPEVDTLYHCSFHKAPTTEKHHIIGFNTNFPSERDRRLVHHFLLYRCLASPNSPIFQHLEQFASRNTGECDNNSTTVCSELIHAFGFSGRPIFFPNHVGILMSESGSEYFMLQVHYDNPNLLGNTTVSFSLDVFYTSNLRKNDASMLLVGGAIPGTSNLIIPPSSLNHVINAHCSPGCTERMIPDEGINIFGAILHTHFAGRNMTLRHFRDGKELPWILWDENYNPEFQNARLLRKEVKIRPGDQLVQRCVYDTTQIGTVVRGGFGTKDEMCIALIYYYTRVPGISTCYSEIRTEEYRNFVDSTLNQTDWSLKLRQELRLHHLFQPQISVCPVPSSQGGMVLEKESVLPRNIPRWRPISKCEGRGSPGGMWDSSYFEYY